MTTGSNSSGTREGGPGSAALLWAADVLGRSDVAVVRGLRQGYSPWLLRAGDCTAILKTGTRAETAGFTTEAAALRLAAAAGLPVPVLLGYDDGTRMLLEYLPGTSDIPGVPDGERLSALGAAAARIHAVSPEPTDALPTRDRPTADLDFAVLRRNLGASSLLLAAEEIVMSARPRDERAAFVHGDLWHGNTVWDGGALSGIIDWDCGGVGPAGVDLGSLRCDAAISYGIEAAALVLAGWEEEAGHSAANVGYWDAVAALSTMPDMGWFTASSGGQSRPDPNEGELLNLRRDAFLRQALTALGC